MPGILRQAHFEEIALLLIFGLSVSPFLEEVHLLELTEDSTLVPPPPPPVHGLTMAFQAPGGGQQEGEASTH